MRGRRPSCVTEKHLKPSVEALCEAKGRAVELKSAVKSSNERFKIYQSQNYAKELLSTRPDLRSGREAPARKLQLVTYILPIVAACT